MGSYWNTEDPESDTETLSDRSRMKSCDRERPDHNEEASTEHKEGTDVLEKATPMDLDIDQSTSKKRCVAGVRVLQTLLTGD